MKKETKNQKYIIIILSFIIAILLSLCIYFMFIKKENYEGNINDDNLQAINTYLDGKIAKNYDYSHLYGKYFLESSGDEYMSIGKTLSECYIDKYNINNLKQLNIYIYNNDINYDDNGYGSPIIYILDFVLKDNSHRIASGYPQEGAILFTELGYEAIGTGIFTNNY